MKIDENTTTILSSFIKNIEDKYRKSDFNKKLTNLTLLEVIKQHKIEYRINEWELNSLNDLYVFDDHFVENLQKNKESIRIDFNEHCQILKEITEYYNSKSLSKLPIAIKGVSVYGITNKEVNIRRSGDIDLISPDPKQLETILIEIGFIKDQHYKVSEHEYSVLTRDTVCIEIHKYIPLVGYSKGIKNKIVNTTTSNQSVFFESVTKLTKSELKYDEIFESAYECKHLGGILIPSINYQILILSAHIFRNYINSFLHWSSGIKLHELYDIYDLINTKGFDRSKLISIINNDERLTSLLFANHLIVKILGKNQLDLPNKEKAQNFPKLLFLNGPMYLPSVSREYLYFNHSDFAEQLNCEEYDISMGGIKKLDLSSNSFNSHGITHISGITIDFKNEALMLTISFLNKPVVNTSDSINISFEGKKCSLSISLDAIAVYEEENGCSFELIEKNKGYSVSCKLPIKSFLPPWKIKGGLILHLVRWGDGPVSTLVPLNIINISNTNT